MRVAVACGGCSNERQVSLKSGNAVLKALLESGYRADLIDITNECEAADLLKPYDFVFIALHGAFGEDGRLQQELENRGIVYSGSGPEACRLSMNKLAFREAIRFLEVPMTELLYGGAVDGFGNEVQLKYPCFVKPASGGSSIGISKVSDAGFLGSAVRTAAAEDNEIVIESAVEGRELAVGILREEALDPIEIITTRPYFDYEAKYADQTTKYEFPDDLNEGIIEKVRSYALKIHRELGCSVFSRVDFIVNSSGVFVLEINAIPGLTSRSLLPMAAIRRGVSFIELCDIIVQDSIREKCDAKKI